MSSAIVAATSAVVAACGSKGSPDNGGEDGGGTSSSGAASSGASSGTSSGGTSSGTSSGGTSSGTSGGGTSSGAPGGGTSSGGASSGSGGGTSSGDAGAGGDGAAAYDYSVYQHHKNGTRDGMYIDPTLTWKPSPDGGAGTGNAVTTHVVTSFTGTVASSYMGTTSSGIYAQPLYVENGPGGVPAFIVATELNHVTAYNATTGAILWDNGPSSTITYGDPVTGGLPCGNINPLGITGTPIIDYGSGEGVIYFDAMTATGGTAKHRVWAVKVEDGSPLSGWPVDVSAAISAFNSPFQNQRGALQLVNGTLYVPYGGAYGDCIDLSKPYYGWVVAISTTNPTHVTSYHTAANKGGIWGPGALPTDGTYVYPVTGNTASSTSTGNSPPTSWGGGEAVLRLGAGATFSGATADYYYPNNWAALDQGDTDLGGASEVLVDMPGTSTPHLVVVGGKDGHIYLLNRDSLGGEGGELFNTYLGTGEFKGAPAAYTTKHGTYVAFRNDGTGVGCANGGNLIAYKITPGTGSANPTASVAWCSTQTDLASPIVTTTDGVSDAIVWDADSHLYAYDGDTGAQLFNGSTTGMDTSVQSFNTPIAIGGGRLAVLVNGELYLFSAP